MHGQYACKGVAVYDWIVGTCVKNGDENGTEYQLPSESKFHDKSFDFTQQHESLHWSARDIPEDNMKRTVSDLVDFCNEKVKLNPKYHLGEYNCQNYKTIDIYSS